MLPTLSPQEFVAKWSKATLKESSAAQEHFIDLCHLVGHPTPAEAGDALSRLWNRVCDAWEGWTLEVWPLEHQRHLLPQTYTDAQYQQARQVVRWYNRRIAQAMRLSDQARSEAIQRTIALLEERAAKVSPLPELGEGPGVRVTWASALWHAAIDQARPTSTASVRFHGFLDEVCQALASFPVQEWPETIRVVGLQHNDWASRLEDLGARPRTVTLAEGPLGDQWRVWAVVEGARLGVIPQDAAIVGCTPLSIPATFTISPTRTYADMHVVTAQVATCLFFADSPIHYLRPIALSHDA